MAISIENTRVPSNSTPNLEVLVGTYEEFVLGYKLSRNSEGGFCFVPSFTNHSHCGSIRAVATSKRFLASGSTDESVRLFSLRDRSEHGYLQQHYGTVTCLEFYHQGYLFTGSDDGNVCVWNTRTWKCEKTLKAHNGGVTSLSIHPTGKLALTVGKDKSLKTWNLIKGRTAYVTNIKAVADFVQWSPEGTHYAVAINNLVNIYEVKLAGISYTIDFKHRVNTVCFLSEEILAIGGEGPSVEIHSIKNKKLVNQFKAHERRVKSASSVKLEGFEASHLVTCSNDGMIKLWRIENVGVEPHLIAQYDTTCRITSLALWTEKAVDKNKEPDVKPILTETTSLPSKVTVETSNHDRPKTLKPLLKRPISKSILVKTSSGPFIAEPIKERDDKRPRLTFVDIAS